MNIIKQIPFVYKSALKLKHAYFNSLTAKAFENYKNNNTEMSLQIGAGQNTLQGFFNTDYFKRDTVHFLDCTKKFPFEDDQFKYIFSEHHIEHIHYKEAKFMLSEIYRVMKRNGVLRICTPNLTTYLESYFKDEPLDDTYPEHILNHWIKNGFHNAVNYTPDDGNENISFFINDIFLNYEHRFIYDFQTLKALLMRCGFRDVQQVLPNLSDVAELNGIESHLEKWAQLTAF